MLCDQESEMFVESKAKSEAEQGKEMDRDRNREKRYHNNNTFKKERVWPSQPQKQQNIGHSKQLCLY